jgi:hypothetical protein
MRFEDFPDKDKFVEAVLKLPNPLDPRTAQAEKYSLVQPEEASESGVARNVTYSICFPPKVLRKYLKWLVTIPMISAADDAEFPDMKFPVNLTLFFSAPPNDLSITTLGLKFLFQHLEDSFVIVIPNFEDHGSSGKDPKNAGITSKIIDKLIQKVSDNINLKFHLEIKITCLTAYSAGYGGLVQSINNELITIDAVQKIVFYDCLCRTDSPKLPKGEKPPLLLPDENNTGPDEVDKSHVKSSFNTRRAIIKAKQKNPNLQVIAYCATSGGSPKYTSGKPSYTVSVDQLIDIRASKGYPKYLFALSLTRVLIMARDEGIISMNDIPQAFIDLHNSIIPARGQIASTSSQQKRSKTGFIPTTNLQAWGDSRLSLIDKATSSFAKAINLIGTKNLFYNGYPSIGNQGGMLHIAQIFEFAWEEFF